MKDQEEILHLFRIVFPKYQRTNVSYLYFHSYCTQKWGTRREIGETEMMLLSTDLEMHDCCDDYFEENKKDYSLTISQDSTRMKKTINVKYGVSTIAVMVCVCPYKLG